MRAGALLRRAFPYILIAVFGFVFAWGVVFFVVLPPTGASHPIASQHDSAAVEDDDGGLPDTQVADSSVEPLPDSAPNIPSPQGSPVSLPDLSGMSLAEARTVLGALQLSTVIQRDTDSFQPENTVLQQTPPVGTIVDRGSTVTLVISYFPPIRDSSAHSGPVVKP